MRWILKSISDVNAINLGNELAASYETWNLDVTPLTYLPTHSNLTWCK